jgi:hypothetical protein
MMTIETARVYLTDEDKESIAQETGIKLATLRGVLAGRIQTSECIGLCIAIAEERKRQYEAKAKELISAKQQHA